MMEATIDEVRGALQSGRNVPGACRVLPRAHRACDKAGPALNAVQTINTRARQEADRLDAAFKSSGAVGPLHCIPVLVKDQVDTSDMPTTYGSAVFKGFVPQKDATIVTRLRNAGAVIVGKASMGEYASVLRLRLRDPFATRTTEPQRERLVHERVRHRRELRDRRYRRGYWRVDPRGPAAVAAWWV